MMDLQEQIAQQNAAIQAIAAGLRALVDELHESGALDRDAVADRLSRLRDERGAPIPTVAALVQAIREGAFASTTQRDRLAVVDGGKGD